MRVITPSVELKRQWTARVELARRHPWWFLLFFVWTCDQHDLVDPIKPTPALRPHIKVMSELWHDNPRLVVVKSRQMLMTWTFVALYLWDALFHQGRLIMFQSKREEDAIGDEVSGDGLLGRAKFILSHMPGRQFVIPEYDEAKHKQGRKILFPWNNSTIWAIPQGAAIIRQRTASGILSDESAFQPSAGDAYVAARPCIRGGGRYTALTTADMADGGHTRALYEDTLDQGDYERSGTRTD
ncbi:MAG TPA: hypothetical protein VM487_07230 [Phycisphaerae bacterium]|nr:hypothetical protein [Phycisphaerae bacterium]